MTATVVASAYLESYLPLALSPVLLLGVIVWFVMKPHCHGGRRLPQIDTMDHKVAQTHVQSCYRHHADHIWWYDERLLRIVRRQRQRIPTQDLHAVDVLRILVQLQRELAHSQHSESSNSDHSYQDT